MTNEQETPRVSEAHAVAKKWKQFLEGENGLEPIGG